MAPKFAGKLTAASRKGFRRSPAALRHQVQERLHTPFRQTHRMEFQEIHGTQEAYSDYLKASADLDRLKSTVERI